jgi:hypothetical protein
MRLSISLGLSALALLAAGCTSEDEPQDDVGPDDSSSSPSGSPSESETPEPESAVNVCGLIDEQLLERVSLGDATPREVLGYGSEQFVMCSVNSFVQFQFGFQIAPGGDGMPEKSSSVTTVEGLGDASVLVQDNPYAATLWTEQDGLLFMVRNDTLGNDDSIPVEQNEAVMRELIAAVAPEIVEQVPAIDLGERCPPADDPAVVAVLGTVVTARGGNVYDGDPGDCQYLGEGGTRANLGYVSQEGAAADFVIVDDEGEKVDMEGAELAVADSFAPGAVKLSWATTPDLAWLIDVTPLGGFPDYENDSGRATVEAVMALGEAYMSVNPEAAAG